MHLQGEPPTSTGCISPWFSALALDLKMTILLEWWILTLDMIKISRWGSFQKKKFFLKKFGFCKRLYQKKN
jgi:hypothetical protein